VHYFLADPVSVPEAERQYYDEKIIDLPCLVTMEPIDEYDLKATSSPPLRANGCFTLGTFCRYEKTSEACLTAFAEILRRVPDARLLFKDNALRRPDAIRRVISLMPGIEPERLLFSTATSHSDHMLSYQMADLCLDPWPHCGGIVSLEQLFMGVARADAIWQQAGRPKHVEHPDRDGSNRVDRPHARGVRREGGGVRREPEGDRGGPQDAAS
jgi:predicted O-linked N-acetylglucosamine transferase (SPINDLY family)